MTYWQKREALYNNKCGANLKELHTQYNKAFNTLKKETEGLYIKITQTGATANSYYQFNKYYDLMNQIDKELIKLGQKSTAIYSKHFAELYTQNFEIVKNELAFKGDINPQRLENALNSIWCKDGKHWSERVWGNTYNLQQTLKDGISNSFITGKSPQEIIKNLKEEFGVEFYKAEKIVRTEMSVIQNKSTMDSYAEAGLEKYRILSNQADDECCDIDGEEFYITDAQIGVNMPPFHPNCRCSITGVI